MPLDSISIRPGDPTVQATGEHRGTVDGTFDDGRMMDVTYKVADGAAWNAALVGAPADLENKMAKNDARAAVSPDEDVAANKEADIAQTCIAYIRTAWNERSANAAWLLYDRINTYVTNHGGWVNAKDDLLAAGLTQEEYDQARNAYLYLSSAGRPTILADAQEVQDTWEGQH